MIGMGQNMHPQGGLGLEQILRAQSEKWILDQRGSQSCQYLQNGRSIPAQVIGCPSPIRQRWRSFRKPCWRWPIV